MNRKPSLWLLATALAATSLFAQPAPVQPPSAADSPAAQSTAPTAPKTPAAEGRERAVALLRDVEQKNKDVETLYGSFHQVRENVMFNEKVVSDGEFWYARPNRFRCDYETPTPMQWFMLGNQVMTYTPKLNQVEIYEMDEEQPPLQMMLGFGIETEKILELFDVRLAEKQPGGDKLTVEFDSRDPSRTFNFSNIRIDFDQSTLQPERIVLQEEDDVVTVTFKKIQLNVAIDEGKLRPDFPKDAEVLTQ